MYLGVQDLKFISITINGCYGDKKMTELLSKQHDGPDYFHIHEIKINEDRGSTFAYIFYSGEFPKDIKI